MAWKKDEWSMSEDALRNLIRYYTREAGVRNLEREIANLPRARRSRKYLLKSRKHIKVARGQHLGKFAGVRKFSFGEAEKEDLVGMVTGLAWTEVGGELLDHRSCYHAGQRQGHYHRQARRRHAGIGAGRYLASMRARARSITASFRPRFQDDRHPRARPRRRLRPRTASALSAGIAMTTAIVSVLTGIPVRKDVAMTGEVTLRGRVLGIGGLKEKLLAALRGGITTVLIPQENVKDLEEIPDNVKQ